MSTEPSSGNETSGYQLKPGWALFDGDDGALVLSGPGDRFARVTGDALVLAAALRTVRDPAPGAEDLARAQDVIEGLRARDVLAMRTSTQSPGSRAVVGGGLEPLVATVARVLAHSGMTVRTVAVPTEDDIASADVLIACAGTLPDQQWSRLDSWCRTHRTTWTRAHGEGDRWCGGPVSISGQGPGYLDWRGRRLAASPAPDQLRQLWRHLESGDAVPTAAPTAAEASVIAGLLCQSVLSPASEDIGQYWEYQPDRGTIATHPVLPLPFRDELENLAAPQVPAAAGARA